MKIVRRLAEGMAAGIVRRAAPEAKDWARATQAELKFIEEDWSALRWSVGGLKVLLRGNCAPLYLTTLARVPAAAQALGKQTRQRAWSMCLVAVIEFWAFGSMLLHLHNPVQRTGCALVLAAMAYLVGQCLWRRAARVPVDVTLLEQTARYREELVRERAFHTGMQFWSRAIALFGALGVVLWGQELAHPGHTLRHPQMLVAVVVLAVCSVPLNRRMAARHLRRIEELDALERQP